MSAAIPHHMFPLARERFIESTEAAGPEPLALAELWGGLDGDLERLQGMLDAAAESLRHSAESMSDAMDCDPAGERLRERFRAQADRIATGVQFHDVASRLIADMRARAQLLEVAALTAAPRAIVEARSRLLREALQVPKHRPDGNCNGSRDVDLFQRGSTSLQEPEAPAWERRF